MSAPTQNVPVVDPTTGLATREWYQTLAGPRFVDYETPTGSDTTFMLAHVPNPTSSLQVFDVATGKRLFPPAFTIVGKQLVLAVTGVVAVSYRY